MMIQFSNALERAWPLMHARLFEPFQAGKWFALGFSAFLASLVEGGSSFNFNFPSEKWKWPTPTIPTSPPPVEATRTAFSSQETLHQAISWGLNTWLVIGAAVLVLLCLLVLLFLWLGCRGEFMLLDNYHHDRAEIKKPWREMKTPANSLFAWHAVIMLVGFLAMSVLLGAALIHFWPEIQAQKAPPFSACWPWIFALLLLSLLYLPLVVYLFFLREFGVPLMYNRNISAPAVNRVLYDLVQQHWVDFLVYLLIRIIMGLVFLLLSCLVGCLTCCIGFLPYLNSVFTLPLRIYRQGFTLHCLGQLSPPDNLIPVTAFSPPPMPPPV